MRSHVQDFVAMTKPTEKAVAPDQAATPDETLEDLLNFKRQRRQSTPIRRGFLQDVEGEGEAAPLHYFVAERRGRALDLLLLLHCGAGAEPWDVELPAMAWARALNMPLTTGSETTVSKSWTWLEDRLLITSDRHNRRRRVFLLAEDGSGEEYARPTGENRGFFHLPFAYFTERWHEQLKLPGKVALLIALGQRPGFVLPSKRVPEWYGISADTWLRGLDELRELGLLETWMTARKAPRARLGFTQDFHHKLTGAFAR